MKIYCFYHYDKSRTKGEYQALLSSGATDSDINPLYAITNKKRIAKEFRQARDMNKFVYIVKEVDKETCMDFMNAHRSLVLDVYNYTFYPKIADNVNQSKEIKILSTQLERNSVEMMCDDSILGFDIGGEDFDFSNPFVLKNKYLEVLRELEYISCFRLYAANSYTHVLDKMIPESEDEDYPELPDIKLDELEVFIYKYGKYFK